MRQLCWSIHAHNSSFLLGKQTQLYQGNFQTRDKVRRCLLSKQTKARFPRSALFVCCATLIPASHEAEGWVGAFWGSILGLGAFPTISLSSSGTCPSLSKEPRKEIWEWAGHCWECLAQTSLQGRTLLCNHLRRCLIPKGEFLTLGSSQKQEPTLLSSGFRGFKSYSYKFYFCITFHLLLSGTKWHQQGGKLQLLAFLGVSSFVCSVGIAPRM